MIQRYCREEMSRIWSDEHRFETMHRVQGAFLEVLSKEKNIPAKELRIFKSLSRRPVAAKVAAKEASSGHEFIGWLSVVADELSVQAPNLVRYLHYGLTSSDILDTAMALQMSEALELLIKDWTLVSARLRVLCNKHEGTWMAGRTHGVHAEPITFGVKLAGWHAEALRNVERLKRAREVISYGKLSGAVGCFSQIGPEYEEEVCARLGLKCEPVSTQVIPRDRYAEYFQALVLSAVAIERFAFEIRHLQKTEVLEVLEPFSMGQKGSSAMPHKQNPILCENLCGLARLMRSYDTAILENTPLWHERDMSHSSVERIVIPDANLILDFMLARFARVLEGLRVDPARMRSNLELTHGLIFSQKVLLRLVESGLGREQAYALVQKSALEAFRAGDSFLKVLMKDPSVMKRLSARELSACFDLKNFKGPQAAILKRAQVRACQ